MKTIEIRQRFLDFFKRNDHTVVPSSSLIPVNDPSLLFTNAGMVQFKDVFLGLEQRDYQRAASSQRCIRAGGKHNDLENVGYTARHHTFFEMLGNFSFGDYFKREAIQYAWSFLTEEMAIPKERLWVTVYHDDKEAEDIWLKELKVDAKRFSRCGAEDNFWTMGETGPCGPCSEIFYDHGSDIPGGPPGSALQDADRYVEIWNLVFMQFNRDAEGHLTALPNPAVDTGMGLERIATVMQGVHDNYDIDLFQTLIAKIKHYADATLCQQHPASLKVIADHIRAAAFLIVDGVTPSNEGRGYVLRRIIRRALRHANKLAATDSFFHHLVAPLVEEMGTAYPELTRASSRIEKALSREEQQFAETLERGLLILRHDIGHLKGNKIAGETIFELYDTYGFPVDLVIDIARERDLQVDLAGFEAMMEEQRQRSRKASQFTDDYTGGVTLDQTVEFVGYTALQEESVISGLLKDKQAVKKLAEGDQGAVILECTPFYAEGGGQVGDKGKLRHKTALFNVTDTQKLGQTYVHYGVLQKGTLQLKEKITATVDADKRNNTAKNHSATHLLHAALREIIGDHVIQKGSLVDEKRLRFDFSHHASLSQDEIVSIERLVNQHIIANHPVEIELMSPKEAEKAGALALFGEKYGDQVRVLTMGNFSKELCGGTHVQRTGDIGLFKIIAESAIASGIRRLEAITGENAFNYIVRLESQLLELSKLLKTNVDHLSDKLQQLLLKQQQMEKQLAKAETQQSKQLTHELAEQAETIKGVKLVVVKLDQVAMQTLRQMVDQLKQQLKKAVIVLVSTTRDRIQVVAGVTEVCVDQCPSARELVQAICGKGGGRADMAQGGGALPSDLDKRLADVRQLIKSRVRTAHRL